MYKMFSRLLHVSCLVLIVPVETLTPKAHESSPWIFGTEPPSGLWRCSMRQAISEEQGNATIQVADRDHLMCLQLN
jgi:hypothetical protein